MSAITTHVLDVSRGAPARGVGVRLERCEQPGLWAELGLSTTDSEGRVRELMAPGIPLSPGLYRITFETGAYFKKHGVRSFYPEVRVTFEILEPAEHYHVPLLLSPFGYSTYRGS